MYYQYTQYMYRIWHFVLFEVTLSSTFGNCNTRSKVLVDADYAAGVTDERKGREGNGFRD